MSGFIASDVLRMRPHEGHALENAYTSTMTVGSYTCLHAAITRTHGQAVKRISPRKLLSRAKDGACKTLDSGKAGMPC